MQVIHLLCPREQVFPLVKLFEAFFENETAYAVAASGFVAKQPVGFIVLTANEIFDDEMLDVIEAHPDVSGYSPFSLSDDDVFPYGCEVATTY